MVPVYRTMINHWMLICSFMLTVQSPMNHVTFCPGQDVTLQCQVLHDADIAAVLWTRSDLKLYMCFYRDGRCDPENQHPSYEHRVEMADQDLKDGNVSVILRNVCDGDVGTYQCHIKEFRDGHVETSGPICTISTSLEAPGESDHLQLGCSLNPDPAGNGTAGNSTAESSRNLGALMLGVPVVFCICMSVYFLYNRQKKPEQKLKQQLDLPVLYKTLRDQLIWLLTPGQESTSKSSGDQDPAGPPSKQQV